MLNRFRSANVLLVEDNSTDVELLKMEFKKNKIHMSLNVVNSGEEALDWVFQRNDYKTAAVPDLILLDINLPGLSGHEVLKQIKSNDDTTLIPVAVLTSSEKDEDLLKAYASLADIFLQKPLNFDSILKCLKHVRGLWLSLSVIDEKFLSVRK